MHCDESLVLADDIVKCIPESISEDGFYVSNLTTDFPNPVEVVDMTNLKIVTNKDGERRSVSVYFKSFDSFF